MKAYPNLSKPIQIGKVTIKNRLFMAPMDTGFGTNSYGGFTNEGVEYFLRRAEGGFGLIFSGATPVDPSDGIDTILNHQKEFIQKGKDLNARMHAYGTKMFMQLSMNIGRNGGLKTPSPLPVWKNPMATTEPLTIGEIHIKIEALGKAAKVCKDAGFAGVDVHGIEWGHLLDSFAMPFMNHRDDEYGGSLENRTRVAKEIVTAIKRECGQDFPVTIRLSLKSYMKDFEKASFDGSEEVGRTLEEAIEIGKLLESYGYDAISTSVGTMDSSYYALPPCYIPMGYTVDMAAKLKEAVSIPVFCGGRMSDPDISEQAIADGKIDAAVIGRQAIADPDTAKRIIAGNPENVRACIGCNLGCVWGNFTLGKIGCSVNPQIGHEAEWRITKSVEPKKVIIVGGGIAGMEAARIAKLRGHDVTLYEKSDVLGGHLISAGAESFKSAVASVNESYKHQMEVLNIDVRMNTEATIEMLRSSGADVIILAVGSNPLMPPIEGIDHPKAVSGVDALLNKKPVGQKVVVIGGGLVGCETAYGCERLGKDVTIVDSHDALMAGGNVPEMNKEMLYDAFEHYNTNIVSNARLQAINDEGAVVKLKDGTLKTLPADTVILSVGFRPLPSMATELTGCGAEIYEIGDGSRIGNVMTCIHDAFEVARKL